MRVFCVYMAMNLNQFLQLEIIYIISNMGCVSDERPYHVQIIHVFCGFIIVGRDMTETVVLISHVYDMALPN